MENLNIQLFAAGPNAVIPSTEGRDGRSIDKVWKQSEMLSRAVQGALGLEFGNVLTIQEAGVKEENKLYLDSLDGRLYRCKKRTESLANTTALFELFSIKTNSDRLDNLFGNGNYISSKKRFLYCSGPLGVGQENSTKHHLFVTIEGVRNYDVIRLYLKPYLYYNTLTQVEDVIIDFYLYNDRIVAPKISKNPIFRSSYMKWNLSDTIDFIFEIDCGCYFTHYMIEYIEFHRGSKLQMVSMEVRECDDFREVDKSDYTLLI